MTYIYIGKQTKKFEFISDRLLELEQFELAATEILPSGKGYYWDGSSWSSPSSQLSTNTSVIEMRSQGIISCQDMSKLALGSEPDKKTEFDILHLASSPPKQGNGGIYLEKSGYLIFPQLESKMGDTISFVFYQGNSSSYLTFGWCSEQFYNFADRDYQKCEHVFRIRGQRGCYYQYGRYKSGRKSFAYQGYAGYDRDLYYRLDIPIVELPLNSSEKQYAELYVLDPSSPLEGIRPRDWLGGKFKQAIEITTNSDRVATDRLYPFMGDYNTVNNPLLGVIRR